MPNNFERFYSNHGEGNSQYGSAHEPIQEYRVMLAGNITADATYILGQVPPGYTGRVIDAIGLTQERGVDTSNALQMVYTPKKGTTALMSTDPAIAKAAAAGLLSTIATATGITKGVVKVDGAAELAAGDILSVVFDITRTASPGPGTEIAGVGFILRVKWYRR